MNRRIGSTVKGLVAGLLALAGAVVLSADPAAASRASIAVDAATGEVLYESRPDHRHYPASLTKMMTLYLLFDALDRGQVSLDTRLPVSARAAGQPPSSLRLKTGETIRVHDAILALVVKSANDVATVVAEALAGEEWKFAQEMTRKADELGMRQTQFRNASGLPNSGQVSTPRDLAILARALLRDFPHHYHYFATETFSYAGRMYKTHNDMLFAYPGADGFKTGYIRSSKFNLVTSAERDGRRVIGVVLGEPTTRARDHKMARLLDTGFARAAPVQVAAATSPADTSPGPPPLKPLISVGGAWAIQVGAFSRLESAYRALEESLKHIPGIVANAAAVVVPFEQGAGGLYRARFVGVDWREAHRGCRILNRKRLDCAVVEHTPDGTAIAFQQ